MATLLRHWPGKRGVSLRFVLLLHEEGPSGPHYDLMLELRAPVDDNDRVLWGLQREELPRGDEVELAWRTHSTHRARYLSYEGVLDGGRGVVTRIDRGLYSVAVRGRRMYLEISGSVLRGYFELCSKNRGTQLWRRLDG